MREAPSMPVAWRVTYLGGSQPRSHWSQRENWCNDGHYHQHIQRYRATARICQGFTVSRPTALSSPRAAGQDWSCSDNRETFQTAAGAQRFIRRPLDRTNWVLWVDDPWPVASRSGGESGAHLCLPRCAAMRLSYPWVRVSSSKYKQPRSALTPRGQARPNEEVSPWNSLRLFFFHRHSRLGERTLQVMKLQSAKPGASSFPGNSYSRPNRPIVSGFGVSAPGTLSLSPAAFVSA